jgi:DNA-binding NarL/FixJ family response regulator
MTLRSSTDLGIEQAAPNGDARGVPRIFICDDDNHYRALLRVVLEGQHEIVGEARTGRECVDVVAGTGAEVILLDVNMPVMDGLQALPLIRELVPDAKVIGLSTGRPEDTEQPFLAAGGDGYIEKPRDITKLHGHLRAALEGREGDNIRLVEELCRLDRADRREEIFAHYAPEVEFVPYFGGGLTLRGVDQIKGYIESLPEGTRSGKTEVAQILATGDDVVVLGVAGITDGSGAVRRFPIGSVITVRDGLVSAIRMYSAWDDARRAAGLAAGTEPAAKRTYRLRPLFMVTDWARRLIIRLGAAGRATVVAPARAA